MKVLIDTCVWSSVLRHKKPDNELAVQFKNLLNDGRIAIIGLVRQELLSGIPAVSEFNRLRKVLTAFDDIPLRTEHFVKAAEFCNTCRSNGIQGSTIDFLICAVAYLEDLIIFTVDKDFESYHRYLPIQLY